MKCEFTWFNMYVYQDYLNSLNAGNSGALAIFVYKMRSYKNSLSIKQDLNRNKKYTFMGFEYLLTETKIGLHVV